LHFNYGYTKQPTEPVIKIRFVNVLEAKRANKVLGKNEVYPIKNLDMHVTQGQYDLLQKYFINFRLIDE